MNLIIIVPVLLAGVPTAIVMWRRCITQNFMKLEWQDHQARIEDWKQRRWDILLPSSLCWITISGLMMLLIGAYELVLHLTLIALLAGICIGIAIEMIISLHRRHQRCKPRPRRSPLSTAH
jgi:hypothetical protein